MKTTGKFYRRSIEMGIRDSFLFGLFLPALVVLFTACQSTTCFAQQPPASTARVGDGASTEQIGALIRSLGADKWETRKLAMDDLIRIGAPTIQPLLERLEKGCNAEVNTRAVKVLTSIAMSDSDRAEDALNALRTAAKMKDRQVSQRALLAMRSIAETLFTIARKPN